MSLQFTLSLSPNYVQLIWLVVAEVAWLFAMMFLLVPVYKRGVQCALRRGRTIEAAGYMPFIVDRNGRRRRNATMAIAIVLGALAQVLVILFSLTFRDEIVSRMELRSVLCQSGQKDSGNGTYVPESQSRCATTNEDDNMFRFKHVVMSGRNVSCTNTLRDDGFAISIDSTMLQRGPLNNCVVGPGFDTTYECDNASVKCVNGPVGTTNGLCEGFLFVGGRVYVAGTGAIQTLSADDDEVYASEGVSVQEARLALRRVAVSAFNARDAVVQEKSKRVCPRSVETGICIGTKFNVWSVTVLIVMAVITTVAVVANVVVRISKENSESNPLFSRRDFVAMAARELTVDMDRSANTNAKIKLYTMRNESGYQQLSLEWREGVAQEQSHDEGIHPPAFYEGTQG